MTNGNDQMITDRKFNARNNSFRGRARKTRLHWNVEVEKDEKCHFEKNILLSNRKSEKRLRLLLIMWMVSSTVVAP